MRLPWLQVDQDGLTRCKLLARLLGVPEAHGIGIGLMAWHWALEMAPDGAFDGSIPCHELLAAATGWPVDDAPRLVAEMQRVGLVATTPALRLRGLDRYRRAWEKNQRRNGKPLDSGGHVPATGANPRGTGAHVAGYRAEPARKTETETETENLRTTLSSELDGEALGSKKSPGVVLTQDEVDVWEHWRTVMGKPRAVITAARKRLIAKWLPAYGVERLQAAIDGCACTPHNMGQNDRHTRYDSLELILRDAEHIERFESATRRGAA